LREKKFSSKTHFLTFSWAQSNSQALTKAKAEIPNPKFQNTKDGFIVFGIWSLELGISMFFPLKAA
jgi:hypothetical protein